MAKDNQPGTPPAPKKPEEAKPTLRLEMLLLAESPVEEFEVDESTQVVGVVRDNRGVKLALARADGEPGRNVKMLVHMVKPGAVAIGVTGTAESRQFVCDGLVMSSTGHAVAIVVEFPA